MPHNFTFSIMRSNLLCICLLLFWSTFSVAQVNDAGLWTSINLEKKITKKIAVDLSQEFRFNENISELGSFFTEISAQYKLHKNLSIGAGYRFINKRELDDSYEKRHRMLFDLNTKEKISKIAVSARIRFQSQYSGVNTSENGKVPDNYLRTKLSVKYDFEKRYTPYLSGETFFHLNAPDGILFDNYRLSFGIEYEFTKRSDIQFGYLIDQEVQVNNPWTSYITTIAYNYRF